MKGDRLVNEAFDLIVRPRVPSASERTEAHDPFAEIAKTGALSSLLAEAPRGLHRREFLIYLEKFLDQTWRMLQRGGLARRIAEESDYGVPPVVGYQVSGYGASTRGRATVTFRPPRHDLAFSSQSDIPWLCA